MDRLAHIEAFVSVVETTSFSRAAERLGIAKSLVSRRVSALEQSLGVQLLHRTTRSLSLTSAGQVYFEHASRILAALDEAEQSVSSDVQDLTGRLRLAAPLSFGLRHLNKALCDFLLERPGIELDLDLNDREVNLVEEGLDMAVRIGSLRDSTLRARRLGTVRFVTCASPGYLSSHGTPVTPEDLASHTGLQYSHVTVNETWHLDSATDRPATTPDIRVQANNGDALVAMAVAGLGIANLPSFLVHDLIAAGELVAILQQHRRPATGIHAVFPPGRLLSRRVRALADFLAGRFGDLPYWDQTIGLRD
ncbi:MAG: LysR family transcriptional regulator [Gammaproteobacteria bacterium]|nr:LysR family transcriptional regulator [Gammaproteobacteria bacterium]